MKKFIPGLIIFIFTLIFAIVGCHTISPVPDVASISSSGEGILAPDFTLPDLSGNEVTLSSLRGKVVLLDFWATWCSPCLFAMPGLQKLHDKYEDKGLKVMSINLGESGAKVKKFIKENGLTYTILLDKSGNTGRIYNVRGIPTMILIDKNGIIQMKQVGYSRWQEEKIVEKIKELLD
ncbi:MAG: TlpA family protein disulfide reductase [Candidatus Eremiobacteraeota bacterium]|nr:TlpA family protein disulfide reductase [Candidatus Eremiobacteraeota bacterium]